MVNFSLILILLKKIIAYQLLTVFWHMISNDAKWPHGLMCPGVKQGCPDQPLTPGSFMRLCSRHGSIDKGHWRGHPLSRFSSIQLKHRLLNQCLLFIGTLIVLIDWHVDQLSVHWAPHNDGCFLISTNRYCVVSSDVKACNMGTWNQVGVTGCKIWGRTHFCCVLSAYY